MKHESREPSFVILHLCFKNFPYVRTMKNKSKYDEVDTLYSYAMRSRLNTNIFLSSIPLKVFSSIAFQFTSSFTLPFSVLKILLDCSNFLFQTKYKIIYCRCEFFRLKIGSQFKV